MAASLATGVSDQAEFEKLARTVYAKLYRLAYQLSRNRADAEDLTQEALLRACRGYASYEGDKPFENWALKILTRIFLDTCRRRSRRVQTVSSDNPSWDTDRHPLPEFVSDSKHGDPEHTLLAQCLSHRMGVTLESLAPSLRTVVWMSDVEGMSYREIAEALDVPIGTVRSRLHRAHTKMRATYGMTDEQFGEK